MKIEQFSRENLKALRASLDEALATISEQHGVALKAGGISFDPRSFRMTIQGAVVSGDGSFATVEAEAFKRDATAYGLTPDLLGKRLTMLEGKAFTIVGLKPKAKKNSIIIRDDNGKQFVTSPITIKHAVAMAGNQSVQP